MGRYLAISVGCHAVILLAFLGFVWSGPSADSQGVYEVEIVAGGPSGEAAADLGGAAAGAPGKRFVYSRTGRAVSIGEVAKERAGKEKGPELDVSREVPRSAEGPEDAGNVSDLIRTPTGSQPGAGSPGPAGGGGAAAIAVWKRRVRGMVEAVWRTPPEIEAVDVTLKTTYLLRVDRPGELIQKRLLVSSGNAPFDRSVLVALGRIQRLPPPPLALIAGGDWVEVTMSFTPPKGAQ